MIDSFEVFPWNENFETGLPLVDEQHRQLVQLLNTLGRHLIYQSDQSTVDTIFNELVEYSVRHFKTEENIWHQFLPTDSWEAHHEEHILFTSEVIRLKSGKSSKPANAVIEDILSFLTHWLAYHILESDMRMARIVLAVQSGLSLEQSKKRANQEMSGAMKVLIKAVLSMYDTLSNRSLQLMKEIQERKETEAKLRLVSNAMDNSLEAICITDADANIIDANPAFYKNNQCTRDEAVGSHLKTFKTGLEDDEELSSTIWGALAEQGHWSGEIWSRTKTGEIDVELLTLSSIKNEQGVVSNYVGVFSNITDLIQQRKKLEHRANHDVLTGLPNRLLLADRIEMSIAYAVRTKGIFALCFLDLDGFKQVNDLMGHDAGDQLLREIAQRLLKVIRGNDTVARVGGDEFVILFGELKKPEDCTEALHRLLREVERPVTLLRSRGLVTASVGVAFFPQDGDNPDTLLRNSDVAMYQAKQLGKSRYHFYDYAYHRNI